MKNQTSSIVLQPQQQKVRLSVDDLEKQLLNLSFKTSSSCDGEIEKKIELVRAIDISKRHYDDNKSGSAPYIVKCACQTALGQHV